MSQIHRDLPGAASRELGEKGALGLKVSTASPKGPSFLTNQTQGHASLERAAVDSKTGSLVFIRGTQDEGRESENMGKPDVCFNNICFFIKIRLICISSPMETL